MFGEDLQKSCNRGHTNTAAPLAFDRRCQFSFLLQEVLELAFSVLYESDEYLNFIAPDKHEVSKY